MAQYAYNQQPQAVPQMTTTSGGNRNAKNLPQDANGKRDWTNGICSCFGDFGTCCVACWCPCIIYGQNKTRVKHLREKGYPHPEGGESCGSDCMVLGLITCFTGLGWILQIPLRNDVRERYRIRGSGGGDCCTIFWCNPCALTQESREIELEEESMLPAGQTKQ